MVLSLFAITLCSAVVVGAVFQTTKTQIDQNKVAAANAAMEKVLPKYDKISPAQSYEVDGGVINIYTATKAGDVVGYAVETFAAGYGGIFKLMVGFDANDKIYKIEVLEHLETPGLGDKINNDKSDYNKQFLGKNLSSDNIELKKDGGVIDAISGSTVSSAAYIVAVKRAYQTLAKNK